MPAWVIEVDWIRIDVSIPIIGNGISRFRRHRISADEPPKGSVVKSGHIVVQPNLNFIALTGVAVVRHGRAAGCPHLTKGGVAQGADQAAAGIHSSAGGTQVVAKQVIDPAGIRATADAHGDACRANVIILLHRTGGAGPLEVVPDVSCSYTSHCSPDPLAIPVVAKTGRGRAADGRQVVFWIVGQVEGLAGGSASEGHVIEGHSA